MRAFLLPIALLFACGDAPTEPASTAAPSAPPAKPEAPAPSVQGEWAMCVKPDVTFAEITDAEMRTAKGNTYPYTVLSEEGATLTVQMPGDDGTPEQSTFTLVGANGLALAKDGKVLPLCRVGADHTADATELHGAWRKDYGGGDTWSELTYAADGSFSNKTRSASGGDSPGLDGRYRVVDRGVHALVLHEVPAIDGKVLGLGALRKVEVTDQGLRWTELDGSVSETRRP